MKLLQKDFYEFILKKSFFHCGLHYHYDSQKLRLKGISDVSNLGYCFLFLVLKILF